MRIGVYYPSTELGLDPVAVRDYAQAAEAMGFDHINCADHVVLSLGPPEKADVEPWRAFYNARNAFAEPLILFSYMAALTVRIRLSTAIMILPQRPTVLVAKQAAELDRLSKGRLRLGVGLGWNRMEYTALGQDSFHQRGKRLEEQIGLLRRLFTEDEVTFKGRWEDLPGGGINPRPVQKPIPIWIGGAADAAVQRAGRLADGILLAPTLRSEAAEPRIELFRAAAREAGRDAASLGIEGSIPCAALGDDAQAWAKDAERWQKAGATDAIFRAIECGYQGVDAHLKAMRRFREAWPA